MCGAFTGGFAMNTTRQIATPWARRFKAGVLGLMMGVAVAAWALPTPHDIDVAVKSGNLAQAETLLREVLRDKPGSAKAHYELGQVLAREGRYLEARDALLQAQRLDASLKFASSPEQFERVLGLVSKSIPQPSSTANAAPVSAAVPVPAPAEPAHAFPLGAVMIGVGTLALLGWWLRRSAARSSTATGAFQPAGRAPWASAGSAGTVQMPQAYPPASGAGSSVAGAVVGGLAGVAAGYALSKALEGDHSRGGDVASQDSPRGGYVPFDAPSQTDWGGFDAGPADSWDAGGSADSGEDW
jgi:hypothetical protein